MLIVSYSMRTSNIVSDIAEEPVIKFPTSIGSSKKQESSRETSALLTMPKPLTVWVTRKCENS